MIFAKKNAFFKIEDIHNFDTYFHTLYKKHCFETVR